MAAYVLVRSGRFFGRTLFTGMVYAPLVMPEVITGLSLLLLFISIAVSSLSSWPTPPLRCASSRSSSRPGLQAGHPHLPSYLS
jgi:ABC-type Fe3+ transport system permease subunit